MNEQFMNILGTTSIIIAILFSLASVLIRTLEGRRIKEIERKKEESINDAIEEATKSIKEQDLHPMSRLGDILKSISASASTSITSYEPEIAKEEAKLYFKGISDDFKLLLDSGIKDNAAYNDKFLEHRLTGIEKKLEKLEYNMVSEDSIKWISTATFFKIIAAIGIVIAIIINAPKLFS